MHTAPGLYVAAVGCSGADDPNYAIGYAAGLLTVNPVIRLDQTGLRVGHGAAGHHRPPVGHSADR